MVTNRAPPFLAAAERRALIDRVDVDRDSTGTEGETDIGGGRRPTQEQRNEGPQVTSNDPNL